ncbi:glycoside hydrolase [Sphingomonas sp. IC081]|uniref:glycoside hydrolase n=1 Tax=Sphingomonas sp. IC081 TaxID=304378 RepID=UPI0021AF0F69|nr:glycoside hydrolase [Sphingomonas sp. IC081]
MPHPFPRGLLALSLWSALAAASPGTTGAGAAVAPPPASLGLDPFYAKYLDAAGIPVVSSAKVPDEALRVARDIVLAETARRPDIRAELVRSGARVGVMAIDEGTMDLPEQRDWKKPAADDPRLTPCERANYATGIAAMTDAQYWNARARGMGGLYTTGAAENLLAVPGTRYYGENILVHEFSHNILSAVERIDPALYGRVEQAYRHALDQGLWKGDYASVTIQEYWAEGTQFWFNSNMAFRHDGTVLLSDRDLRAYDPMLHAVLAEVYAPGHHIAADAFYNHPARLTPPRPRKASAC